MSWTQLIFVALALRLRSHEGEVQAFIPHMASVARSRELRVRLQVTSTNPPPPDAHLTLGDILPMDMYKESSEGEDTCASLDLLLTGSDLDMDNEGVDTVVCVSMQQLKERWLDFCIENNRPNDADKFDLGIASRLASREDAHVIIENIEADLSAHEVGDEVEDTVYLTEQQLRALWARQVMEPMAKPERNFDVKEALLLLPDDEDALVLAPGGVSTTADTDTMLLWSKMVTETSDDVDDDDEGDGLGNGDGDKDETLYVTSDELLRVWNRRSTGKWGMPAAAFDDKLALLLLDDDADEGVMTTGTTSGNDSAHSDSFLEREASEAEDGFKYVPATECFKNRDVDEDYWEERYPGKAPGQQWMRDNLKLMYRELENMDPVRPAWKKDRHILTPDIDTQTFEGDIMNSNTYMTQRVPANWDDPERSEMSDIYLSTGSMSWEGEELTDFNDKKSVWEVLDLPLHLVKGQSSSGVDGELVAEADKGGSGAVDWTTFDFASIEDSQASAEVQADGTFASSALDGKGADDEDPDAIDIESFFKDVEEDDDEPAEDTARDTDFERDAVELVAGKAYESLKPKVVKWTTPPDWLKNPEFASHVGYDEWSTYGLAQEAGTDPRGLEGGAFEDRDDEWQDDDILTALAMRHVLRVTDEFLEDHMLASARAEEHRYWEREIAVVTTGDESLRDVPIPSYLTPDIDEGVEYSDELIEMKGKMSLHVKMQPPAELYAEDTFTHNDELTALNRVGTVREQYEWQPTTDSSQWFIDEAVVAEIQPLLRLVNHAAELRSTKDNVLVFEYKARLRHIVGIREMMLKTAKECFPKIVDLRLETERTNDKFDV